MKLPPRFYAVFPGGASHVATIAGSALELDKLGIILGAAGISAGGLVAIATAFGKLDKLGDLLRHWLQHDRILDVWPDGKLGICKGERIPAIIDALIGPGARMSDADMPLVLVVTRRVAGRTRPVYLSSWATPNVLVSEAGGATAALVPLFPMRTIPSLGTAMSPDIVKSYDGGFTDNLPDHVFDGRADPTVSIGLDVVESKTGKPSVTRDDAISQALDIADAITFAQSQRKTKRSDGLHIPVRAEGSGLDFSLTVPEIDRRIENGRRGVRAALEAS